MMIIMAVFACIFDWKQECFVDVNTIVLKEIQILQHDHNQSMVIQIQQTVQHISNTKMNNENHFIAILTLFNMCYMTRLDAVYKLETDILLFCWYTKYFVNKRSGQRAIK